MNSTKDNEKKYSHSNKMNTFKNPKQTSSTKENESKNTKNSSPKKSNEQNISTKKYTKQLVYSDSDEDSEEESEEESEEDSEESEEESEEEEEYIIKTRSKTKSEKKDDSKVNIVFTIHDELGNDYGSLEDDIEIEDEDDIETENEDDEVSSVESDSKKRKKKTAKKEINSKEFISSFHKTISDGSKNFDEKILETMKNLYKSTADESFKECIKVYQANLKKQKEKKEKKDKKQKEKNVRIFSKISRDKNVLNDIDVFSTLTCGEQVTTIKELKKINDLIRIKTPYKLTLINSSIPTHFKSCAMKKINMLKYMDSSSGEYYKLKQWVDNFMRIPFNKFKQLEISMDDGIEKCSEYMENAQQILNTAVYGLNDAKIQIMQLLGNLITNPSSVGTSIAIQGPMGIGKTTLIKEGISKILNRPFAFIALGGATDSTFLEGHSYTYEGSTWGKIVEILIQTQCANPVIYFDELDKISDTPKGEEIIGILTHLTDTTQNSQFHDKYFSEIDFDLSKCFFIFSYNDESKVNPILRDRMYRINMKGYNLKDKIIIAQQYLLKALESQVCFKEGEIILPESVLTYIIENFCEKEEGVRNLKRCLEIIYTKINLYRLIKPDTELFDKHKSIKITFPFTITNLLVDKFIKKKEESSFMSTLYI